MKYKRYYFKFNNKKAYFTPREKQVADLLIQKKTSKNIGEELRLSNRTVEYYITLVKFKLEINKKSDLIASLKQVLPNVTCKEIS